MYLQRATRLRVHKVTLGHPVLRQISASMHVPAAGDLAHEFMQAAKKRP